MGWRYPGHPVKMACCCIRACNDDTEKEITINVTHQNMNFREPKFDTAKIQSLL